MKFEDTTGCQINIYSLRDRFIAGDDECYATIYRLYAKDLYAFGISLQVNTDMIEDAIHDVFVDVYAHKNRLKNVDNLKSYFIAAFRNRLFYLLKKESRWNNVDSDESLNNLKEKDIQEIWIENDAQTEKELLIKNLFLKLNEHQREALYHRFVEGLSCEEIADTMHINYQSAKNLIHRAVKKLRSVGSVIPTLIVFIYMFSHNNWR